MIEPKEEDVGRSVLYNTKYSLQTKGVITSFNKYWVFVRYTWQSQDAGGLPTKRENLEWENPDLSDGFKKE